jgi:hypothetical protein
VSYRTDIDGIDELAPPDAPGATVTYTWYDDGLTDFAQPYAVLITREPGNPPDIGSTTTLAVPPAGNVWIDALDDRPPTASSRWRPLTSPGNHRHPDYLDEIEKQRRTLGLAPLWPLHR